MNRKKIITIVAIVLAVVVVAGVVTVAVLSNQKEPDHGHTYNTYLAVSPSNWNELNYQDSNDSNIMSYIGSSFFEFNFKFDSNGNIVEGDYVVDYSAATKLEDVTAQYKEAWGLAGDKGYAYKITLREDLVWDNGDPINADDFIYSMQEQLNPLFLNYRADSYYAGSVNLVGAKYYAKQGQKGLDDSTAYFEHYSTDLDDKLVFTLGGEGTKVNMGTKDEPNEKNVIGNSYFRQGMGFPASYNAATTAKYMYTYYLANTAFNKTSAAALEGKTLAQIKADPELKAAFDVLYAWWEPSSDDEILHFFYYIDGEYPEQSWDTVGLIKGDTDYELVVIMTDPLYLIKADGSLDYTAAYNFSSLPLVHKATYEACKKAPTEGSTLWTTTYNTTLETTRSWGPYKLTKYQSGKEYVLEKNEKWFGYRLKQYEGQYETEKIHCEIIKEWSTAWAKFLSGEIDGIGIDVSVSADYKNSKRAIFTADDYVGSMQLQSDKEALKKRESDGINKTILSYTDFRKALSLSIDRSDYTQKNTTASFAGFGLYNSMHYYDVANAGLYRDTDAAKKALCEVYGVDWTKYSNLDDAVNAVTGYNLTLAKELLTNAYNEALAAGDIKAGDKVVLTFGSSTITESEQRSVDYLASTWSKLAEGTPLEGKIEVEFKEFGTTWSDDFKGGAYDICMAGWTGAAWDPGYFLLAYLGENYRYALAWKPEGTQMTFTMRGVGENGEDVTETMDLLSWYNCLNGNSGAAYDWSEGVVDSEVRCELIAAIEKEILLTYYTVPMYNYFSASLLSYKLDYITTTYNTFMGYGGIRYAHYNYDNDGWTAEVKANGGELNYKV